MAEKTAEALQRNHPGIQIAGFLTPPFRPLGQDEMREIADTINQSGADVLWVCLGCPKQEIWMSEMRDLLNVKVILAVGQAFDILAGRTERAPAVLRKAGLEWAFRLCQEPKRLWKRYLVTNLLFLALVTREALMHPFHSSVRRHVAGDERV